MHPILHFAIFFFFYNGLFSFVHPIIHFGIGGFFYSSLSCPTFFFRSSYSSLCNLFLLLYWTFFFIHPIIHFGIGGFFLPHFLPRSLSIGDLFLSPHPIIHFVLEVFFASFQFFTSSSFSFFIQEFFLSAILLFTSF